MNKVLLLSALSISGLSCGESIEEGDYISVEDTSELSQELCANSPIGAPVLEDVWQGAAYDTDSDYGGPYGYKPCSRGCIRQGSYGAVQFRDTKIDNTHMWEYYFTIGERGGFWIFRQQYECDVVTYGYSLQCPGGLQAYCGYLNP